MILYINTSKEQQLDVFLIEENKIMDQLNLKGDFKVSENLLKMIEQLLKKNKIDFKQLKGLITITGPGPFTSLRIATAVANTLAYSLKIPVIGIKNNKNLNDKQLLDLGCQELKKAKQGIYIKPFYDKEPNITKTKT